MKFGKVDINEKDPKWETWTWKDFLAFYESSLKGNLTESPEEIGKALGVKVPREKLKSGNA